MTSFFKNLFRPPVVLPKPQRRSPLGFRPKLDLLEDRTAPAVLTVNTIADGPITPDSNLTLREAIAAVNAGSTSALSTAEQAQITGTLGTSDTIQFDPTLTASAAKIVSLTEDELSLTSSVIINGPGTTLLTIERSSSAATNFRIFEVASGITVSINNLSISKGAPAADESGGGILNSGTLNVSYVTFSGNTVTGAGGGGAIENSGTLNASFSRFSGNNGSFGGAIDQDNPGVSTATITGCLFDNNTALSGGGLRSDGDATVINSTFSGNSATSNGGGVRNNGTLTMINCTIVGNTADSDDDTDGVGGGIKTTDAATTAGCLTTLYNTLVAGNHMGTASPVASDLDSDVNVAAASSNNLIGDAGTAGGLTDANQGNLVGNAGTGVRDITTIVSTTLASNGGATPTLALVENSPAIGAGSDTVPGFIRYDQREAARDPSAAEIGAYEVQHPLSPVGVPETYAATFLPKPSPDANTAYVKGLYHSTLLRDGEQDGINFWVGKLTSGAMTRQQVAYGFINSYENRSTEVLFFYRYFLGRDPDPDGLQFHVTRLQNGVDEGDEMINFILSPEFTGQTNNTQFVNLMYYSLLGRQAEQSGFDFWKNALDTGAKSRSDEVNGFLRSDESINRVVNTYFASYLKRFSDTAGVSSYANEIKSHKTFGTVASEILSTDEFFTAAGNNLT